MKKLLYTTILIIVSMLSYNLGGQEIYMAADCRQDGTKSIWYPHFENKEETLIQQRELIIALFEGLHRFYSNDDHESWFTDFVPTKEYAKIDSLLNGDWEDFYHYSTPLLEDWFSVYGTEKEPSEEYKDSIQFGLK